MGVLCVLHDNRFVVVCAQSVTGVWWHLLVWTYINLAFHLLQTINLKISLGIFEVNLRCNVILRLTWLKLLMKLIVSPQKFILVYDYKVRVMIIFKSVPFEKQITATYNLYTNKNRFSIVLKYKFHFEYLLQRRLSYKFWFHFVMIPLKQDLILMMSV